MKAIVVKDNSFQTIGFEVCQGNITLVRWGVSPHSTVFVKEVEVKEWSREIFEISNLQSVVCERERFVSQFFKVAAQKVETTETGFDFTEYKQETQLIKNRIENIVKNII